MRLLRKRLPKMGLLGESVTADGMTPARFRARLTDPNAPRRAPMARLALTVVVGLLGVAAQAVERDAVAQDAAQATAPCQDDHGAGSVYGA